MTKTPYHWTCNACGAQSAASDMDIAFAAAYAHCMHYIGAQEHFDFNFWKEIPEPKK